MSVDIKSVKTQEIIDFNDMKTNEEEIYKFLYDIVSNLGFTDKTYMIFEAEQFHNTLYSNTPFCIIVSNGINYEDIFQKSLKGDVKICKSKHNFNIGFFDTNVLNLFILRDLFLKSLYINGFNSNIFQNIYYEIGIVGSEIESFFSIKRDLRSIEIMLTFDYEINYISNQDLEFIERFKVGSEKHSEIDYVIVENNEEED